MAARLRMTVMLGVAGAASLALTGCGGNAVAAGDVEEQISGQLSEQIGQEPDEVSCPEDLPAEEGSELTCELTDGDDTYDVMVTVTSVQDDTVNFDIEVADTPS